MRHLRAWLQRGRPGAPRVPRVRPTRTAAPRSPHTAPGPPRPRPHVLGGRGTCRWPSKSRDEVLAEQLWSAPKGQSAGRKGSRPPTRKRGARLRAHVGPGDGGAEGCAGRGRGLERTGRSRGHRVRLRITRTQEKKKKNPRNRERKGGWLGSAEQRERGDRRWVRARGGFSPETKAHLRLLGLGFCGSDLRLLLPLPTAKR